MKINNDWKTINVYKYMNSGISNSGETVNLNLPNTINDTSVFGYISYIEYLDNIMSVKLKKEIYTPSMFSFKIETTYGKKINSYSYKKELYQSDGGYYLHSYSGKGFSIDVQIGGTGSDGGGGSLKYRYIKQNGSYSDWVTILQHSDKWNNNPAFKSYVIDFEDIYPLTKSTSIEIQVNLWKNGRYGHSYCYYTITPFNYTPMTITDKGNIHWFVFAN